MPGTSKSSNAEIEPEERVIKNELKAIQCKLKDFKIVFFTVGG